MLEDREKKENVYEYMSFSILQDAWDTCIYKSYVCVTVIIECKLSA